MSTINPLGVDELALALPPQQKLRLIQRLAQSLEVPQSADVEQRRAREELFQKLSALPVANPSDGLSGADHDRILYGDRS